MISSPVSRRTVGAVVVCVCFFIPGTVAAFDWLDDFEDGELLDGAPSCDEGVCWLPELCTGVGSHQIMSGDLYLQNDDRPDVSIVEAFVTPVSGDVSVRSQVTFIGGGPQTEVNLVIGAGTCDNLYSYNAYLNRNGSLRLYRWDGTQPWPNWPLLGIKQLDGFEPEDDYLFQLDRVGDTLEVRCWPPCEPMPEAPAITAEDATYLDGYVGVTYTSFVGDPAARGVLRFFHVANSRIEESAEEADCPGPEKFLRGDCNDDGKVDISDPIHTLNRLFSGGPASGCLAATDVNGDGGVNISDPTYLLNHLFAGLGAPVAPYPECGVSDLPSDGVLRCENPPACP